MNEVKYGEIVKAYVNYQINKELAEWRLGHLPILEELGSLTGQCILDFGCGPANFSSVLSEGGAKVIGFDSDGEVIAEARLTDPHGDYRVYRGLLFKEVAREEVGTIIATLSICTIPDRELRYILQDMRQILKTGGRLLILEPNQEKAHGVQYADLHYHYKEGVRTGDLVDVTLGSVASAVAIPPDIYRTHADYRELLEEAGFIIDRMDEPRPEASWKGDWEMESKYPPFLLISAH